jgi:DNA-binding FadR family transcriptional regulator
LPRYFETRFAIGDRTTAEFLQNRNNWEIVNALVDAGAKGVTSEQLAKQLNIGYKVVADTMKHLAQMGWATSERPKPKVGRPAKETQKRDFRKPPYLHT